MIDELERICKEAVVAYFRYYPRICLQGLRKIIKHLSQDSRCRSRESNRAPPTGVYTPCRVAVYIVPSCTKILCFEYIFWNSPLDEERISVHAIMVLNPAPVTSLRGAEQGCYLYFIHLLDPGSSLYGFVL
jgi:hypothetical protein